MDAPREVTASLLGYFLDGWADVIEGMGSNAEDVRSDIMKQLKERNMPYVMVERANMREGVISEKGHRDYVITSTFPGVTTTIYIAKHGNDLFASWRTFIRTTINETYMMIYSGIALSLVFLQGIITGGSWTAYLKGDFTNLVSILSSIQQFIKAIFILIAFSIPVFVIILVLVIIAGIILKRNIFAFILKEPSLFDQEDITAMSLTVHKTMLRSLDMAGIDVSKLRLKGDFKAGRRGESI